MKSIKIILIAIFLSILEIEMMLGASLTFPGGTSFTGMTILKISSIIFFIVSICYMFKERKESKIQNGE